MANEVDFEWNEFVRNVQGPKYSRLRQTIEWITRPCEFMEHLFDKYGDTFYIDILGWGRLILTCDMKIVDRCFREDDQKLSASGANRILEPIVGSNSVFLAEGSSHRSKRRKISSCLHLGQHLDQIRPLLRSIIKKFSEENFREIVDPQSWLSTITAHLMFSLIFGKEDEKSARHLKTKMDPLLGPLSSMYAFS